jgi:hypothetical protein
VTSTETDDGREPPDANLGAVARAANPFWAATTAGVETLKQCKMTAKPAVTNKLSPEAGRRKPSLPQRARADPNQAFDWRGSYVGTAPLEVGFEP